MIGIKAENNFVVTGLGYLELKKIGQTTHSLIPHPSYTQQQDRYEHENFPTRKELKSDC